MTPVATVSREQSAPRERGLNVIENPLTGERVRFLRRATPHADRYLRYELALAPGARGQRPHRHPSCVEYVRVLAGAVTATVAGADRELTAGEEVEFPAGVPHRLSNPGETRADLVVEFTGCAEAFSALAFERMLETEFGLARDAAPGPRAKPGVLQRAVVLEAYGHLTRGTAPWPLQRLFAVGLGAIGRRLGCRPWYRRYNSRTAG